MPGTGGANGFRHRILIVGAGPGGLCMGIKLREAGIRDFIILEKAPGIGGTWWHNRYPGAACDVPSHLYSFSFALKRDWSRPFAPAAEILDYLHSCADRYGVTPHVRCGAEVKAARWDEATSCWQVSTAGGALYQADVLIAAQGMFNEPAWPAIPGLDEFAGPRFHTARWDHRHDLAGERVGVIGSAASAVQCVPEIAAVAQRLCVFQRTPNWVLPKRDRPYTADKRDYFLYAPDAVEHNRARFFGEFDDLSLLNDPERYQAAADSGLANIALVEDTAVRRALTPAYPFGCKRVLLSSNYYQAFNRDNVELVTAPIERIIPAGVRTADGREHALDSLVFATGFQVSRYFSTVDVVGREGRSLAAAWSEGAQAYLGIATSGFPNLFQLYGPNTNKGSILFMIECQVAYILRQLAHMEAQNVAWVDVKPDVMAAYNDGIQADANAIAVWSADCNNYFRHPGSRRIVTQYPRDMARYRLDTVTPDPQAYLAAARGNR